jgi:LysR family glycine cleavage system transcriptional activator
LLRSVAPWLDRLDATVRQIRNKRGRQVVTVTTFASFASLWLIPRLEAFQREHQGIDIRVSAFDAIADLGDPDIDIALRYCAPERAPPDAEELFGETLTPVVSPWLAEQARNGQASPLGAVTDLQGHSLIEEDDDRPSAQFLTWRHWLAQQGVPQLEPRRWMYLNFTYQQVQAALTGQGVALGRIALIAEQLERGELVEPFGLAGRIGSPSRYWMAVAEGSRQRTEVQEFREWISAQAAMTRAAIPGNDR